MSEEKKSRERGGAREIVATKYLLAFRRVRYFTEEILYWGKYSEGINIPNFRNKDISDLLYEYISLKDKTPEEDKKKIKHFYINPLEEDFSETTGLFKLFGPIKTTEDYKEAVKKININFESGRFSKIFPKIKGIIDEIIELKEEYKKTVLVFELFSINTEYKDGHTFLVFPEEIIDEKSGNKTYKFHLIDSTGNYTDIIKGRDEQGFTLSYILFDFISQKLGVSIECYGNYSPQNILNKYIDEEVKRKTVGDGAAVGDGVEQPYNDDPYGFYSLPSFSSRAATGGGAGSSSSSSSSGGGTTVAVSGDRVSDEVRMLKNLINTCNLWSMYFLDLFLKSRLSFTDFWRLISSSLLKDGKILLYLIRGYYTYITRRFLLDYGVDISKIDTKIKGLSETQKKIKKEEIRKHIDELREKTIKGLYAMSDETVEEYTIDPDEIPITDKDDYESGIQELRDYIKEEIVKGKKLPKIEKSDEYKKFYKGQNAFNLSLNPKHGIVFQKEKIIPFLDLEEKIVKSYLEKFYKKQDGERKIVFSLFFYKSFELGHSITCIIYPKIGKLVLLDSNGFIKDDVYSKIYNGMTIQELKTSILKFIQDNKDVIFKKEYIISNISDIIDIPSFNLQYEICEEKQCTERERGSCGIFSRFLRSIIMMFKKLKILDILEIINEEVIFKDSSQDKQNLFAIIRQTWYNRLEKEKKRLKDIEEEKLRKKKEKKEEKENIELFGKREPRENTEEIIETLRQKREIKKQEEIKKERLGKIEGRRRIGKQSFGKKKSVKKPKKPVKKSVKKPKKLVKKSKKSIKKPVKKPVKKSKKSIKKPVKSKKPVKKSKKSIKKTIKKSKKSIKKPVKKSKKSKTKKYKCN